ncbi:putative immunity protein [Methanoregula sp.]|uniref:putative immunity protein n=1 Tax=Methanoregula sp. TaxID=2052170 RepID=UPI0026332F1B|nr:hypothetical protein [Methanoregula sp.]MDD5143440.1 hypothetical protein [Methanoregula sp.]
MALVSAVRRDVSGILERPYTETIDHRAFQPDKRILVLWAADCAEHVLPFFTSECRGDERPNLAIITCREWAATGIFRMADIRKASVDAHAAARDAQGADAKFAAHAAGQAVAAIHVPTHAFGCSVYAIRAAAAHTGNVSDGLIRERGWQMECLRRHTADREPA